MQKCTHDVCTYFYLQIRMNVPLAFVPFWALRGLRGMMLLIFIHEVLIVVNVCLAVAYALKQSRKVMNGLFRFDV